MSLGDFTADPLAPLFGLWRYGFLDTAQPAPFARQAWLQQGAGVPVNPAPSTSWDFMTGVLDARITASGGANGSRVNAAGNLAPAVTPRFDYDPVTLQPLGCYVEAAGTNIQTQSSVFTTAPWVHTDITVTGANTLAPDGAVTGTRIVEGSANTAQTINAQLTITSGLVYSVSRYFKYSNCRWVMMSVTNPSFANGANVWFDIQNGVVGAQQALGTGTAVVGRIYPAGNGWYRCAVSVILGAITGMLWRTSSAANDFSLVKQSGATYYMWGSQVEQIVNPTSLIQTAGSTVTRTADSLILTGTNFTSWYNATQGSMMVEHDLGGFSGANNPLFSIDDNTTGSKIVALRTGPLGVANLSVAVASVAQASYPTVNFAAAQTVAKAIAAWKLNDFALVLNGGAVAVDTAGTIPTVTQMRLGGVTPVAAYLNGRIRKMQYWNTRLTDSQLQVATS